MEPINHQIEFIGAELPLLKKIAFANPWLFKNPILKAIKCSYNYCSNYYYWGSKNNVIPTIAEATINFRILPGETIESVKKHIINTVSDKVRVESVGFLTNPSPVSSINSEGFKILEKTIRGMFPKSMLFQD